MVKAAKITRIVAPTLVFISMVFAILALATGNSVPWLVGQDVRVIQDLTASDIDEDPFYDDCGISCNGRPALILQLEFYIGRGVAEYCGLQDGDDPETDECEDSGDFPIILDQTYGDYLFDDDGLTTPFVMLYDGCEIGSTTVLVVVSLGIILMFGSLFLDALSFRRRFDKPRVSTFLLVLGWAFTLAALITWVLTCQATATTLYSDITIGTGFIFLVVSIFIGFFAGAVRIFRVNDFTYEQQVYI